MGFSVGTAAAGGVGLAACITQAGAPPAGAFVNGFAWLTIPNTAVIDPSYCGAVLTNTQADTTASVVTGDGAQFQIRVTTTGGNQGIAGTGFDLVYAQVGC